MKNEKQTSFDSDADVALAIAAEAGQPEGSMAQIIEFPVQPEIAEQPSAGDTIIQQYGELATDMPEATTLRPTERAKRIGKGLLASAALAGLLTAGLSQTGGAERETRDIPTQTDMAEPGATLWDMTGNVKNVEDRRDVIQWAETNSPDLADGSLDVGDEVITPLDAKDLK